MPYEFTAESFSKFTEDILQAGGDQATLTTLLADMQGTVTEAIAKDIAGTEKVNTVTAENERLKKANMDLFLRVGSAAMKTEEEKKTEEEAEQIDTAQYMQKYFNSLDVREKK